jgi:hypothetical protein
MSCKFFNKIKTLETFRENSITDLILSFNKLIVILCSGNFLILNNVLEFLTSINLIVLYIENFKILVAA